MKSPRERVEGNVNTLLNSFGNLGRMKGVDLSDKELDAIEQVILAKLQETMNKLRTKDDDIGFTLDG